jgi:hypothetical protein
MVPQPEHGACQHQSANSVRRHVTLTALAVLLSAWAAFAQNFGEWSPPASVDPGRTAINTRFNDGCPIEAPDGNTLFFASNRANDLDIWVAYRTSESAPWGAVERLPNPVNGVGSNEFCPTPLPGNRLLFVSTRPNPNQCGGKADIYMTRQHPVHGWLEPVPLNCDINSAGDEFSPSLVEADGVTTLFFSSERLQFGQHKIYSAVQQPDGAWRPASPVDELNMPGASDARPNVRKDGLEIVFDSTRFGLPSQVYTATRSSVLEPWSAPVPVGAVLNVTTGQSRASISRDGTRLYFGSTRANVPGDQGADIFVSTRSGPGSK